MSAEKIREEFKEWARRRGLSIPVNDSIQLNQWTQLAWEAWQAAEEAMLKKQLREQEEFLDHLADFEPEDTLYV